MADENDLLRNNSIDIFFQKQQNIEKQIPATVKS